MAELQRIEELDARLNGKEPAWIRGYSKRENHLSGELREMADSMMGYDPAQMPGSNELKLRELLTEAAETLDDAHENWLNLTLAARDIVGDIGAMKSNVEPLGHGHWFGGFSRSEEIGEYVVETFIEWPNLDISSKQLVAVLQDKEYKL